MAEILDVRELVGVSMNARTASADSLPDRQVTLGALAFASDLGRMLWRMKYGRDVQRNGINRAALLLAAKLRADRRFGKFRQRPTHSNTGPAYGDTVERLALQSLVEWIDDRCRGCGGHGIVGGKERTPEPSVVQCRHCCGRARIWLPGYRNATVECGHCIGTGKEVIQPKPVKLDFCTLCGGSGKRRIDAMARARAIAVSVDAYHRHWEDRYAVAHTVLDEVDAWVETVLKEQRRS